jgi:hypothetical protein
MARQQGSRQVLRTRPAGAVCAQQQQQQLLAYGVAAAVFLITGLQFISCWRQPSSSITPTIAYLSTCLSHGPTPPTNCHVMHSFLTLCSPPLQAAAGIFRIRARLAPELRGCRLPRR